MKSIMVVPKDTKMGRTSLCAKKDEKCLIPTTDCFWKDLHDVINCIKTCSQSEKQKTIGWKCIMNYFNR